MPSDAVRRCPEFTEITALKRHLPTAVPDGVDAKAMLHQFSLRYALSAVLTVGVLGGAVSSCRWNYDLAYSELELGGAGDAGSAGGSVAGSDGNVGGSSAAGSSVGGNAGTAGTADDGSTAGGGVSGASGGSGSSGSAGTSATGGGGIGGGGGSGTGGTSGSSGASGSGGAATTYSITWSGNTSTASYGEVGAGSNLYSDTCPGNEVVIGYRGTIDTNTIITIGSVQTICGRLVVTNSGGTFTVTTQAGTTLPRRGGNNGPSWSQICPANQVVVTFQGRSGLLLDQVAFGCAPLNIVNGQVVRGSVTVLPAAGGNGGSAFSDGCPAGRIARGANVRTDSNDFWIETLGLICAAPSLRATP